MKYEITQQQLQGIVNYLLEKPYKEAAPLINLIQSLQQVKNDEPEEDEDNG